VGTLTALLLSFFRMLPKIVEQPDILPSSRSRSLGLGVFSGTSLGSVITLFSLRTLLRSRQHRMILSFYLGIGLTIILGFIHTKFVIGLPARPPGSHSHAATIPAQLLTPDHAVSITYLLASILTVSLTVLALRVVIAIPITLKANWIFRATQVRPAHRYHRAVRTSLLFLGVVPVLFALSTAFFSHYSPLQIVAHLIAMTLLGTLIVELCLFTFQKISFACSYLPGKANLHFVFWVALLASMSWLKDAASFEGRMLSNAHDFALMTATLAATAIAMHLITSTRARQTEQLIFEEDNLPEIVSLKLNS
jgi:putative flippase GtrA